MKLFDWLNQITLYKKDWDTFEDNDHKSFNKFMIVRFLSMNKQWIEAVNHLQKYTISMESKDVYNLFKNLLPREKKFLRYIKGKKDKSYKSELVDILVKYFECSKLQVNEYIDLLSKEQLTNILITYGKSKKEIKSLLK